ncbi:hypothetical protein [Vibrio nigripulchritudo]|uniref:hypothetical protein n=1 Tax=Vibrio nigripulchritudo TaxID=28173 RepID=UPI0003B217B4|nr:hypothetical protein [Vibrio nigripulchritudo]CCN73219.1 hypothetical protein VIBNISFn118_770019 [Vibrio nigripulchritudo SFn118]
MLKQKEFEKNLQQLKNSAINRNTQQGIKVYDWALDSLSKASSEDEFNNILKKVKNALGGIEAHGEFTDEEFQAVTSIRQIDAF